MPISAQVQIARRFQKSIQVEADLGDVRALEGFVCPESSASTLANMAEQYSSVGHGAFTWTGPYGSGKSSLALAFASALGGGASERSVSERVLGESLYKKLASAFFPNSERWKFIPVTGRRADPLNVIADSLEKEGILTSGGSAVSEDALIDAISRPKEGGSARVVLLIDEMGKFLEAAARDTGDIYFFQRLAEAASRSEGKFLLIGILHQSMDEYANRLAREARDEWAKIQGRFIDLPVDALGGEQLFLLSQAIENSSFSSPSFRELSSKTADLLKISAATSKVEVEKSLNGCWPLHPVVACLLGPVSRRRFGQNQRSIFGFLNSAEPHGFRDYCQSAEDGQLYAPDNLWDYLRTNFEPAILASPDGHRWAMATDALERCEAAGGSELDVRVLKAIAIVDLLRERSGLTASNDLLHCIFWETPKRSVTASLKRLDSWSITIFKKFMGARSLFAGSDFDIEGALAEAQSEIQQVGIDSLRSLAGLQPILAKRHYHETGTLRWFDLSLVSYTELNDTSTVLRPKAGFVGRFLLVIPEEEMYQIDLKAKVDAAVSGDYDFDLVLGFSPACWRIPLAAKELLAIDYVANNNPSLAGDRVARVEVQSRLSEAQEALLNLIQEALREATWHRKGERPRLLSQASLNGLASDLCEARYHAAPLLKNELLNRHRPSSSAIAAQNALLRAMVLNEGESRLGLEGFSAEAGLFISLLEQTGLYRSLGDGFGYATLETWTDDDEFRIAPLFRFSRQFFKEKGTALTPLAELLDLWGAPPFGIKNGLKPILSVAFILAERGSLAIYRDEVFRPQFDDVDVEYLAKNPSGIQLRWMESGAESAAILDLFSVAARELGLEHLPERNEPVMVGSCLVNAVVTQPAWTNRTSSLSKEATYLRDLLKRAHDPAKLLFEDLPEALGINSEATTEAELAHAKTVLKSLLIEMRGFYSERLEELKRLLLAELKVPTSDEKGLSALRERARNIINVAGDFRLDAFVGRMVRFDGSIEAVEGVAALAAGRPPRDWVDIDADRAALELAEMSQKFLKVEAFARVKGRAHNRSSMALVGGLGAGSESSIWEFDISEGEKSQVDALVGLISKAISSDSGVSTNVVLAALGEVARIRGEAALAKDDGDKEASNGAR